jgi:hypothetical protein
LYRRPNKRCGDPSNESLEIASTESFAGTSKPKMVPGLVGSGDPARRSGFTADAHPWILLMSRPPRGKVQMATDNANYRSLLEIVFNRSTPHFDGASPALPFRLLELSPFVEITGSVVVVPKDMSNRAHPFSMVRQSPFLTLRFRRPLQIRKARLKIFQFGGFVPGQIRTLRHAVAPCKTPAPQSALWALLVAYSKCGGDGNSRVVLPTCGGARRACGYPQSPYTYRILGFRLWTKPP